MKIQHWKIIAFGLMLYDIVAIAFSYFFALLVRFDFRFTSIPAEYLYSFERFFPFYTVAAILFFWYMCMYRSVWRFAGFNELVRYAAASLIASGAHTLVISQVYRHMPSSYYVIGAVVQLILVVGIRFSYRFYTQVLAGKDAAGDAKPTKKAMIIGAGAAGNIVIRELQQSDKTNITPVCIIDDNPNK